MWKAVATPGSKTYYYHTTTNETVWDKPKDIWTPLDHKLAAASWTCYETEQGKPYWYNALTKTSVWNCPIDATTYKELCTSFKGVSFADAMEKLAEHPEYWELEFAERVRQFEEVTVSVSEEQLKEKLKNYLSARELLQLCRNEVLVRKLLKDYTLDENAKSRLCEALKSEPMDDLVKTEERLHSALEYPRDPKLIALYKQRLDQLETEKLESEKEQALQLEIPAAKVRLAFLDELKQTDLSQDWVAIAPQLRPLIEKFTGMPGSTAAQLFNEAKAAFLSDQQAELRAAEQALSRANKSIDRVTPAQFEALVQLRNPKRVYEQLKSASTAKRPKLDFLEY